MASTANQAKAPPAATGPVLTNAGAAAAAAAWRQGVTLAGEDARRALKPDVAAPFASFEDAVARLLPYHVFGAEEGDEADVDEAAATGGTLLASRVAQWDDMCLRKVAEFGVTLKRQADALDEAVAKRQAAAGELRAEERFLTARLPLDEQRQRHAAGRALLAARNVAMGLGPLAQGAPQAAAGNGVGGVQRPPPQPNAPLSLVPQQHGDTVMEAAGREYAQPLGSRGPPRP